MKNYPKNVPISGRVRVCLELVQEQNIAGKVVVDVGSSFGWLEKEIIKMKPKKIIGIETDRAAVDFAKKNVKRAQFLVGNALNLPVKENFADIVILYDLIEHVPKGSEPKVLKEAARVLKKNGILLFSTPYSNFFSNIFDVAWYFGHRHYSKESIIKILRQGRFKIISIISKGSIFSSLYLTWFYIAKLIQKRPQPRNSLFEKLDNMGYMEEGITDIFLVAKKLD